MIEIEKDTPVEYSKQSRDYQVFSFLYSALFNQVKMYADLIRGIWTDDIDDKLLLPRSYTVNFIPKFSWENSDLRGVTNCFRYLVRRKGTKAAIEGCLRILARIKGIELTGLSVQIGTDGIVKLILNEEIADVGNVEDLLRYILPAGCGYEIIKYIKMDTSVESEIVLKNEGIKLNSEGSSPYYKSETLFLTSEGGVYPIPLHEYSQYTGMIVTKGGSEMTTSYVVVHGTSISTVYNGSDQTNNAGVTYDLVGLPSTAWVRAYDRETGTSEITDFSISGKNANSYSLNLGAFDWKVFETSESTSEMEGVQVAIGQNPTINIAPASVSVTFAGSTKTVVYNGLEQENTDISLTVDPTSPFVDTIAPFVITDGTYQWKVSGTNASTYEGDALVPEQFGFATNNDDPANFNVSFVPATDDERLKLVIEKMPITSIHIKGPEITEYWDYTNWGSGKTTSTTAISSFPTGYTVITDPELPLQISEYLNGQNTPLSFIHSSDIGTYSKDFTVDFVENTNYKFEGEITYDPIVVNVVKKPITVTIMPPTIAQPEPTTSPPKSPFSLMFRSLTLAEQQFIFGFGYTITYYNKVTGQEVDPRDAWNTVGVYTVSVDLGTEIVPYYDITVRTGLLEVGQ